MCGRVINLSTEDPKLKESSIGLFNANYDLQCRLRLNMSEVPQYSLFEGEIIVAEGFMDTKKFNVNRIWKPAVVPSLSSQIDRQDIEVFQKNQGSKALEYMVACGPFTVNNELSYDALKDLMMNVKREQPNALILTGPFISHSHEDIISGDLKFKDPENGSD